MCLILISLSVNSVQLGQLLLHLTLSLPEFFMFYYAATNSMFDHFHKVELPPTILLYEYLNM